MACTQSPVKVEPDILLTEPVPGFELTSIRFRLVLVHRKVAISPA